MEAEREELSNVVRSQLKSLNKTLVLPFENPLVYMEKLTDDVLQQYKIRRVNFDIEKTPDRESDILFDPLPESMLRRHRINEKRAKAEHPSYLCVNLEPAPEEFKECTSLKLATSICRHLRKWVTSFPRYGFHGSSDLESYVGWDPIRIPNPYLLNTNGADLRRDFEKNWAIENTREWGVTEDNCPHLILWAPQRYVGHEGSLQYGEIASLITSMRARAFQRNIPEDELYEKELSEDEDGLHKFRHNRKRLEKYPFTFKEECKYPTLMVSFLGTDARLLYACMDADTLVIHQSKLYSFEDPLTAPWDLFARWLVSSPVEDASPSPTVLPVIQGRGTVKTTDFGRL